jgi:hypothetical protein
MLAVKEPMSRTESLMLGNGVSKLALTGEASFENPNLGQCVTPAKKSH